MMSTSTQWTIALTVTTAALVFVAVIVLGVI
jgi:hypothetical protein